jgi:sodium/potassium-transporting ATPase subunit alpha
MLPPSVSFNAGDVEARRRVELVDATGLNDVHAQRAFTSPGNRLPIEYRTLSIHVESRIPDETRGAATSEKQQPQPKVRAMAIIFPSCLTLTGSQSEFSTLEWHRLTVDEVLTRLAVSPKTGLESAQAQRRLQTHGRNVISPPKSNLWRKLLEWILGGFGSLLLVASIICFIAW